jgi:alanyl-tRNA synthetase
MNRLLMILLVSLATSVQAGVPRITETESGITVEYTGSPPSASSGSEISDSAAKDDKAMMVKEITAQIDELKQEAAEILRLTGRENEDEVAIKKELAADKFRQIEAYANEIFKLEGEARKLAADTLQAREEQPIREQNYQQETQQRIRELKKMRRFYPMPADPQ